MDRSTVYTGEIPRSYDLLKGWRRAYIALGFALTDTLGGTEDSATGEATSGSLGDNIYAALYDHGGGTAASPLASPKAVLNGFSIAINYLGTTPESRAVTISPGAVYCSMKTDLVQAQAAAWNAAVTSGAAAIAALSALYPVSAGALTGYGDIAADATGETAQFIVPAAQLGPLTKPGSGSNFYLIEVVPAQIDYTASDDPNVSASAPYNAVLPYFNAANPSLPLQGPGGTNPPTQQPSVREATGLVQLSANSPQTSAAALLCDSGALPLYVIQIESTDTNIASARVWAAGLGTAPAISASGLQLAPFLRGTMQQHHLGVQGSAPKIDGGAEWLPKSTVNNNGQALAAFSYLAGTALNVTSPANNPPTYLTSGLASFVNTGSCLIDSKATDGAGLINIAFTSTALSTGTNLVARIETASGLNPDCVQLFPNNEAAAVILSQGGFFYVVPAGASGQWYVYLFVAAAGFTIGSVTASFGYLAIF